jgi:hypothetical protein
MIQVPTPSIGARGFGSTKPHPEPDPWRHTSRDLDNHIPTPRVYARARTWTAAFDEIALEDLERQDMLGVGRRL